MIDDKEVRDFIIELYESSKNKNIDLQITKLKNDGVFYQIFSEKNIIWKSTLTINELQLMYLVNLDIEIQELLINALNTTNVKTI